ncbi:MULTISPECIES: MFS transporter [Chryseobacterium]|uniref:MFS transporter n=3 Tax=Chryseobacterium TaxID=59732 RepID=A0A3N0VYL2_9FLAO|nr:MULTISPECIES: MFS transporter [Chryseobacterium]MDR6462691.1 MFS family permease [Chryseobacterium sediminis]RKE81631.1 MFS transporter [Chryseobacterium sp. AG363]ROH97903.1 MFS transporter [Chryseobacterium daecheongense]TDX92920.1 MFS transporter [Chryseobacterium daecheongense]
MKYTDKGLLTTISLCILLASLGTSIVNIALPSLTAFFAASFQAIQWVVIAYLLTITAFVAIAGKLADQHGHEKTLLFGIVVFTLSSLASAYVSNIWLLIVMRAIQGVGAAILLTVSMAMVKRNIAKERTGTAMGILGTMSAIGTAIGPSAGGLLLSHFGWPSIFLLLTFLGITVFFLAKRFLTKEEPIYRSGQIHFADMLLLSFTVGTYALAMTISKESFNIYTLLLFLVSLLLGMLFFLVQKRRTHRLIDVSITKNKLLISSLLRNLIVSCLMMTTLIVGPFFLASGLGFSNDVVGGIMSIGPMISIFTGIPSGKIVDNIGTELTMNTSLIILLAGTLCLALLPGIFGWVGYVIGIILLTPGYQLFQAANNTSIMSTVGEKQTGAVSGILNLSRNIGLITGASLMGTLFMKATESAPEAASQSERMFFGLQITFLFVAFLLIPLILKSLVHKYKLNKK